MENRITYIDLAKGVAIFLVIVGHADIPEYLKSFIYSFHMPLFFILSGYFMKVYNMDLKQESKKLFRSLILPYFVIAILIRVLTTAFDCVEGNQVNIFDWLTIPLVLWRMGGGDIFSVGAIWFLPVLFLAKLYIGYLMKKKYGSETLLLGAFVSVMITRVTGVILPFGIQNVLSCAPFVYIGVLLNRYAIFNRIENKFSTATLFSFAIPIFIYACSYGVAMRANSVPFMAYITATVISICFILLLKWAECNRPNSVLCRFFSWCGRYSLIILCIHSVEARIPYIHGNYFWALEICVSFALIVFFSFCCTKISLTRKLFSLK